MFNARACTAPVPKHPALTSNYQPLQGDDEIGAVRWAPSAEWSRHHRPGRI
jgi:hypothetical protein